MLKLYIVRHGQTEWNRDRRLQGRQDSSLTEIGKKQAIALGEYLKEKGIAIDKFYSSPQKRAYDTALSIAKGAEVYKRDNLCEIGFGAWEGSRVDEIKEQNSENFENFFTHANRYDHIPHGGESFEEVEARVKDELDYITSTYKNNSLMWVSHGITIKMILKILNNHSLAEFWNTEVFENSSLSLITFDGDKFNVEYISNTEHLAEGLSTGWTAK